MTALEGRPRPGFRITKDQAKDVGAVIGRLLEAGNATAGELVAKAKAKRSPAHQHFNWNDKTAAHNHRLECARKYLRGIVLVRVTFEDGGDAGEETVRLVHDADQERYRSQEDVADDAPLAGRVMDDALRGLTAWVERYGWLAGIAGDHKAQRAARRVRALL